MDRAGTSTLGLADQFTIAIAPVVLAQASSAAIPLHGSWGRVGLEVVSDTIPSASDHSLVCSEPRIAPRLPTRRVPQEGVVSGGSAWGLSALGVGSPVGA